MEVNINKCLKIDEQCDTQVFKNTNEPFCSVCFIDDEHLFVQVTHSTLMKHYHFIWNLKQGCIENERTLCVDMIHSSPTNYPIDSYYNDETNEIYCFYREGHHFTMKRDNIKEAI